MLKDIKNINDWDKFKKRKFFWSFTISWSLFVWLIGGEWLYFIPFIVGDVIFWKTFNYTFWKKRKKEEKKPKGWLGSWGDAILFAVIAATILRTFFIEAYTIPTPSMEKSLMVGDYLFVDKYMDSKWNSKTYSNHYRIGGMKLTLDGSPQGRTAWRTQPYLIAPDGAKEGYLGYPAIPNDSLVISIYEKGFKNNWQILTHANGDAAMDQMIRSIEPIASKYGNTNRRNVLIHGQYVREDQLDSFKKLDIITSLFPLHTFYWGDWHKEIIGDSLGNKISPTRTALNKGLKITIHTDAPVALPNLMRMVGISVERKSRSGKIIGANEKLTPYEALKGITIWSAYQHFEEKTKGTLEQGKLADLVILDMNPLKVSEEKIKEIKVLETIKEGVSVYKK